MTEKGQTNVNPNGVDTTSGGGGALGAFVKDSGMLRSKATTRPWTGADALRQAQANRNADTSVRKDGR